MRTLSLDTSPGAEQVQIALLRTAPIWQKLRLVDDFNHTLHVVALSVLRQRHGQATLGELHRRLADQWLGAELANRAYGSEPFMGESAMMGHSIPVALLVIEQLEKQNIPYLIGGSIASSAHGSFRATQDADLVVDMQPHHVDQFVQALSGAFYVDSDAVYNAIRRRASFNLIHLETMFKVDVFIQKRRPFDKAQFERRTAYAIAQEPERSAYLATAEDSVLAKLEWYRGGGEVSDRQWTDILGILKVQAEGLDQGYLRHWAAALGLTDLLERAFDDAGLA